MSGPGPSWVLKPWLRKLVLGSEALRSPQVVQLLKVLRDSETPGPSSAPDTPDAGAVLLVSDGTHSVRCLVTRLALDSSEWEEKEFGFRGAEGRLLLLKACTARLGVAQDPAVTPAEFFIQVDRFLLLSVQHPRVQVTSCNQDSDVQKKLCEYLEGVPSESAASSTGTALSLTQLLDAAEDDQDRWGALMRLAEGCLVLAGPLTASSHPNWTTSCFQATEEEAVFAVPSLLLHISENDEQILSSIGSSQKAQGAPGSLSHMPLEESGASVSLLSALAKSDSGQKGGCQPLPAVCPSSPRPQAPSPDLAHVTRAQAHSQEELQQPIRKRLLFPRTRARGAQESRSVWEPPKRHRDASTFQYKYETPSAPLHAQVQTARLSNQLVAWALNLVMEPESELAQV